MTTKPTAKKFRIRTPGAAAATPAAPEPLRPAEAEAPRPVPPQQPTLDEPADVPATGDAPEGSADIEDIRREGLT
ncbi:MAG: capsule biosynthesis protein, partial [Alphaproteobacteria bacterium]|nr:capsule biosynthesis protein [Alphaproteobacteria bacterium]